ncbi:unnamed protein product [Rotaria socialis]
MQLPSRMIDDNSNFKCDWADLVALGKKGKYRFYTAWVGPLYLRAFHLNPIYYETKWIERDRQGVELASSVPKNLKHSLLDAFHRKVDENFTDVMTAHT